jgi:uncharacterized protein with HEPN domain
VKPGTSDPQALRLHLMQVLEALERIPRRINGSHEAEEFLAGEEGVDRLDAICMMLIAVGEAFKQIDRKTGGHLLPRYPEVDWVGVKGVRDVVAHGYFDVDADQVFAICQQDGCPSPVADGAPHDRRSCRLGPGRRAASGWGMIRPLSSRTHLGHHMKAIEGKPP